MAAAARSAVRKLGMDPLAEVVTLSPDLVGALEH
jgi:hypothetical protein